MGFEVSYYGAPGTGRNVVCTYLYVANRNYVFVINLNANVYVKNWERLSNKADPFLTNLSYD